jgi:diguanylate cyclase (GGDEF)-like protein
MKKVERFLEKHGSMVPVMTASRDGEPSLISLGFCPISAAMVAPGHIPRGINHWIIWKLLFAAAVAASMWWLVWSTVGARLHWLHSLFVPVSVVLAGCLLVLRNERRWARPARRLVDLLEQIRAGDQAIESLNEIKGGLAELVPLIQQVLHDTKQQKQAMAELNDEMRQRVANRTDALERQIGSLRQQASRDPLTGLFNRRMLDAYLPQLLAKCREEKLDLSLLMIDVDHFKPLNDTLGHSAGDGLLRDIAHIIRSGVRDQDAAFRLGGDEFAVLLPGAGAEVAQAIAARMRDLVDALARPLRVAEPPALSIGVACLSQMRNVDHDSLLREADRKLYEVKATRRTPLARAG